MRRCCSATCATARFRTPRKRPALPGGVTFISVAAGDVNKDGFVDLFLGRQGATGTLLLNERGAAFRAAGDASPTPLNAVASQFIDYDNDGLLDLVTLSSTGRASVWRNLGRTWADVTTTAFKTINPPEEPNAAASASGKSARGGFLGFVAGDLDRDGDTDLIVKARGGAMAILENQGGNKNASVRVRLTGRASNRSGIGSKVEMRAGSLWQRLESTSTSPAIAPARSSRSASARARKPTWCACCGRRGSCRPSRSPIRPRPARSEGAVARAHRARSEAVILSVSLHVERREVRVRHRFHGRRRDGLSARAGRAQRAGPGGIRADSRRSAEGARRPLRAARDQRARRSAVRRSPAARRHRASAGSGSASERRPVRAAVSRARTDDRARREAGRRACSIMPDAM